MTENDKPADGSQGDYKPIDKVSGTPGIPSDDLLDQMSLIPSDDLVARAAAMEPVGSDEEHMGQSDIDSLLAEDGLRDPTPETTEPIVIGEEDSQMTSLLDGLGDDTDGPVVDAYPADTPFIDTREAVASLFDDQIYQLERHDVTVPDLPEFEAVPGLKEYLQKALVEAYLVWFGRDGGPVTRRKADQDLRKLSDYIGSRVYTREEVESRFNEMVRSAVDILEGREAYLESEGTEIVRPRGAEPTPVDRDVGECATRPEEVRARPRYVSNILKAVAKYVIEHW